MSDEYVVEVQDLGAQNDGEPIAVVEEPQNLAEAVEAASEVSAEEPEPEEPGEEPKKKTGSQRARERAQRLEAENEALRRLLTQQQPPKEVPPAPKTDEPRAEDFDSHEAWVKASIRYEAKKLLEEEKTQAQIQSRQQSWNQKADQARSKYEDFDEVLQDAPAPSQSVAEVLAESPIGADVAYHLATHPELYRRLNSLGPVAAARELGILEATLAPKERATKTTTKAPKPVAPVSTPSAVKVVADGYSVY